MTNTKRDEFRPSDIARNFYYKINYHIKEATLTDAQAEIIMDEFVKDYRPSAGGLSVEEIEEILYQQSVKGINKDGDKTANIPCGHFDLVAEEIYKAQSRPSPAGGLSLEKLTKILEDNNAGIYGTIGGWYGGKLSCSILAEAIVSAQSRERGEKSTPETVEHDVSVYGVAIQKDGKRIDPKDFYKASSSDSKIERTPTKPINNQEIDRRDGEAVECLKEIVGYIDKEGPCAKEWQAISDLCEKANQIISKHGGKA